MTSVGHDDAATIADTVFDHSTSEWDPYEESIAETATVVDTDSIREKEVDSKSLALAKEKYYNYDVPSSSRPRLFQVIRGIGALPFRAMTSAASLAQRMLAMCNADMQVRGAVLANAAIIHRRYSGSSKMTGHSRYMITDVPPKQRILRNHIRSIHQHTQETRTTGQPGDLRSYLELIHIICTIIRAPRTIYDDSLFWNAWDLLITEMRGSQLAILIDALCHPECESADLGTILRHLALGRLSGWKKHAHFTTTAAEVARTASFASDTYETVLATNHGFFSMLSGLVRRRPWAVHEALDDHVHLVWFKYATQAQPLMKSPRGTSSHSWPAPYQPAIKWSYFLDNVALDYVQYAKRFDPKLSPEASSFLQLITSNAHTGYDSKTKEYETPHETASDLLKYLLAHLTDVLTVIATAAEPHTKDKRPKLHEFCDNPCCDIPVDFNAETTLSIFRDHPSLASAELAHPVLPILCVLAELVSISPIALTELINTSSASGSNAVFGYLHTLWTHQFLLPSDFRWGTWAGAGMGPGRWVLKEKRTYALRLATCLFLAQATKAAVRGTAGDGDWDCMNALAGRLTETQERKAWTWDVISSALCLQTHFSKLISRALNAEVPLTKEQKKDKEVHYVYANVLGQVEYLAQYLGAQQSPPTLETSREVPVEKLVLIFEDVPPEIPAQVLASILRTSTTSKEWTAALSILEAVSPSTAPRLARTLTFFIRQLLEGAPTASSPRVAQLLRRSTSELDLSTEARLFMPHPADRFVMLLAGAAARKSYVGTALRADGETVNALRELLDTLEGGHFDDSFEVTHSGTRDEQMRWRTRMCSQLRCILIGA